MHIIIDIGAQMQNIHQWHWHRIFSSSLQLFNCLYVCVMPHHLRLYSCCSLNLSWSNMMHVVATAYSICSFCFVYILHMYDYTYLLFHKYVLAIIIYVNVCMYIYVKHMCFGYWQYAREVCIEYDYNNIICILVYKYVCM